MTYSKQPELPFAQSPQIDALLRQYEQTRTAYSHLQHAKKNSSASLPPNDYGVVRSQARLITDELNKPLYISQEEAISLENTVQILSNRRGRPAVHAKDLAERIQEIEHIDSGLAKKQVKRINSAFHHYLDTGVFEGVQRNYEQSANELVEESQKILTRTDSNDTQYREQLQRALRTIDQSVLSRKNKKMYDQVQSTLYKAAGPATARKHLAEIKKILEDD